MQICIEHGATVETTGGCASSINVKVELPHQTNKNMFLIQLLSCGQSD